MEREKIEKIEKAYKEFKNKMGIKHRVEYLRESDVIINNLIKSLAENLYITYTPKEIEQNLNLALANYYMKYRISYAESARDIDKPYDKLISKLKAAIAS